MLEATYSSVLETFQFGLKQESFMNRRFIDVSGIYDKGTNG